MAVLLAGFGLYRIREPALREQAAQEQKVTYRGLGEQLFANNCASCHGVNGIGAEAPRLNAREFLASTTDEQMKLLITGGVSGTDMPAWGIDFGGPFTDEQIQQIITYIRSWEPTAPSVPDWRRGAEASPAPSPSPAG
jgi:mono/diheme cytochrome c family protein